jgi:uncharacterized membrane protein YhhN
VLELAIAVAASAMALDWLGVFRGWLRLEELAKPAVMLALIGVVAASDPSEVGAAVAVVVALASALVGDVLLLPRIDRFIAGLIAFVATHVAYMAGFVVAGVDPALLVVGAVVAAATSVLVGRPIVAGATLLDLQLGRAVVAYVTILSAMWACGIALGDLIALAGATLFVASDAVLGWNRFVAALPYGRLLTHVPYHLGQGLIVVWVVSA